MQKNTFAQECNDVFSTFTTKKKLKQSESNTQILAKKKLFLIVFMPSKWLKALESISNC